MKVSTVAGILLFGTTAAFACIKLGERCPDGSQNCCDEDRGVRCIGNPNKMICQWTTSTSAGNEIDHIDDSAAVAEAPCKKIYESPCLYHSDCCD